LRKIAVYAILIFVSLLIVCPVQAAENVKNVNVSIFPQTAGQAAQYIIGFNVSSTGALKGGRDEIFITFPDGSKIPDTIPEDAIMVNGYPVDTRTIEIDGYTVSFEVPKEINIANNSYVGVIIDRIANIRTPNRSGSYPIAVSTTFDSLNYSDKFTLSGTGLTKVSASLNPSAINEYAEYLITFRTSSSGSLTGGTDYIYLEFPEAVDLPRTIKGDLIKINKKAIPDASVEVDTADNRISIKLPSNISIGNREDVEILISSEARIRNPRYTGNYDIYVYTSKDTLGSEAEFNIGLTVSRPKVMVSPNQAGMISQYTIGFTTSSKGELQGGKDYINIIFPDSMSVPSSIATSAITVNGQNASYISVVRSERKIAVRLPNSLSLDGNSYVNVVIKGEAQLRNPSTAGSYRLDISTSADVTATKSEEFLILGESIENPRIRLSNNMVGAIPAIEINFEANSAGGLKGGKDTVTVEFPSEFQMPVDIDERDITVNNKVVKNSFISGQRLTFTLPDGLELDEGDNVLVRISDSANIKNPEETGSYYLELSTSLDIGKVRSSRFSIRDQNSAVNQQPMVELTNNTAGAVSQYLIAFYNTMSVLEEGDIIELFFPDGTILPSRISEELVTINGYVAEDVDVNVDKIAIELPEDLEIDYDEKVIVIISQAAGIKNPAEAGAYKISVDLGSGSVQESTAYTITGGQSSGRQVVFRIGSTLYSNRGVLQTLDAAPTIINGRTMIPVRALADALGAETSYDSVARTVTIKYGDKEILLVIDSTLARVNNQWVSLDTPATIVNNRTLIPVRFVSQSFGAVVEWNEATSEITITQ